MLKITHRIHLAPPALPMPPAVLSSQKALWAAEAGSQFTASKPLEPTATYDKPKHISNAAAQAAKPAAAPEAIHQSLLDALRNSPAPANFSASPYLAQLGALSGQAQQNLNGTLHVEVPGAEVEKAQGDNTAQAGSAQQSLKLAIRTQEGDEVVLDLRHRAGPTGDAVDLRFKVAGNLSSQEQQAVDQLAQKISALSDSFFRGDGAALQGLNDLDTQQLQSFQINLGRNTDQGAVTTDYQFAIGPHTGRRHLAGKDENGYSFAIDAQRNKTTGQLVASNAALQGYLQTLNQATEKAETPAQSKQFLQAALSALLLTQDSASALVPAPMAPPSSDTLEAFDSGLADFNASFSLYKNSGSEVLPNMPKTMNLHLQQTTQKHTTEQGVIIQQVASYEFDASLIEPLAGASQPDLTGGNFMVKTLHESAKNIRGLEIAHGSVKDGTEDKTSQEKTTAKIYRNFALQSEKQTSNGDHQTRALSQQYDMVKLNERHDTLIAALKAFTTAPLFL